MTAFRRRFRPWQWFGIAILVIVAIGFGVREYGLNYHFRQAQSSLHNEQTLTAREHAQWCVRWAPWNSDYQFLAARTARISSDFVAAEEHLNRCLKIDGGPTERLQLEFLLIRVQSGEIDQLAGLLFSLVERPEGYPDSEAILSTLGKVYMRSLRYRPALACMSRWIELNPNNPKAYYWRGWNYERMSNKSAALADFLKALELDPAMLDVRLRVTEMYLEEKQSPEALPHAEYLMQLAPNDPRVQARMGMCQFLLGQPEEARRLMEAAVVQLPDDAALLVTLANLDLQQGRTEDAERRLRHILRADPSDTEALFVLSTALQNLGKSEEAKTVMADCIAKRKMVDRIHDLLKDATDTPNAKSDDYAEIGELFLQIGREKFGVYWLQQALERNANNQRAHRALAEHFQKIGDVATAALHQRQLTAHSPSKANPSSPK